MALKKSELYPSLWKSCDELRGGMDASQYKDYVLILLFVKYVSDKYAGDPNALIEVPVGGGFADMVAAKGSKEIGDRINKIIGRLADANDSLKGAINVADFNDEEKLGKADAVVRRSPAGAPVLHLLRWGLVPHWSQDPTRGPRPINARSETVRAKPAFRDAFLKRRCLIPADGFYEWQTQEGTKQPFFFSDPQGQILALAGLWESWRAPDGGLLRTCCILTTAANAQVARVHERMPLILAARSWATWLEGPAGAAQALLVPAPEEALRGWPVSPRVNRVAEDGADLLAPMAAS